MLKVTFSNAPHDEIPDRSKHAYPLAKFRGKLFLNNLAASGKNYRSKKLALERMAKTGVTDHPAAIFGIAIFLVIWVTLVVVILEDTFTVFSGLDYARSVQDWAIFVDGAWGLSVESWAWIFGVISFGFVIRAGGYIEFVFRTVDRMGIEPKWWMKITVSTVFLVIYLPAALLTFINVPLYLAFAVWAAVPVALFTVLPVLAIATVAKTSDFVAKGTPIRSAYHVGGLTLLVIGFVVQLIGTVVERN